MFKIIAIATAGILASNATGGNILAGFLAGLFTFWLWAFVFNNAEGREFRSR